MVGFGGGMLLIAAIPFFVPAAAIIPIHGIVQIASNSSRMLFSIKDVKWSLLPAFLIGSVLGIASFGILIINLPTDYIPMWIGLYLLCSLWLPRFSNIMKRLENDYLIGFLQTGLGLIVGATGPLALAKLTNTLQSKDQIIATSAMFMTISHLAKIPVFIVLAAPIFNHLPLIITMVCGAILGSYLGTKLRMSISNDKAVATIKILLTILALRMIILVFI
jgi:uncharacterized membrane protein YfcA